MLKNLSRAAKVSRVKGRLPSARTKASATSSAANAAWQGYFPFLRNGKKTTSEAKRAEWTWFSAIGKRDRAVRRVERLEGRLNRLETHNTLWDRLRRFVLGK